MIGQNKVSEIARTSTASVSIDCNLDPAARTPSVRTSWKSHVIGAPEYLPTLDGWRAIAIAFVVISHVSYAPLPASQLRSLAISLGPKGVDIFFALSGFLITSRLLTERRRFGGISLRKFYLRRAFRLLPASLTYLALLSLLAKKGVTDASAGEVVASIFFLRNFTYCVLPG